jgi:hypothetical protein
MASTATDVTGAMRDFGAGMETQYRALGLTARDAVVAVVRDMAFPARISRGHRPPALLASWVTGALGIRMWFLGTEVRELYAHPRRGEITIVDRSLTRC